MGIRSKNIKNSLKSKACKPAFAYFILCSVFIHFKSPTFCFANETDGKANSTQEVLNRKPANAIEREKIIQSKTAPTLEPEKLSDSEIARKRQEETEKAAIEQQIFKQEQAAQRRNGNVLEQSNPQQNTKTAERMVQIVKDHEFQRALEMITPRARELLEDNPELHTPVGILVGMASLWNGRKFKIVKSDEVTLDTQIQARTSTAQFSWNSPLLNGELKYQAANGVNVSVGRSISSINTKTRVEYNLTSGNLSSSIEQPLPNNFSISIRGGQTSGKPDGAAVLNYQLNF